MYDMTVEQLASLLREAEAAHGEFEKTLGHRDENWPQWYADYVLKKSHQYSSSPS